MTQNHKYSFYIILGIIFLIPLFFIPGGILAPAMAKTTLFVVGTVLVLLLFVYETWKGGRFDLPKHSIVWSVVALPVVYLLSALLATPSSLSLFGYGLEVGTFGFVLIGAILLLLSASVFSDPTRPLQALTALFLSLTVLALFVIIKLFAGESFTLGQFFGNMDNPLGSWTDLGIVFALLASFSVLALGVIPMKGLMKALLYLSFFVSVMLMVVTGFTTAFGFSLAAAVFLYFYFRKVESGFLFMGSKGEQGSEGNKGGFIAGPTLLPIVLGVVVLVFLINPNIGENKPLGSVVSSAFGVSNAEVRPSLSATLGVSKAVLSQAGLLGSGPNTFGRDWLVHKPASVNATPFWAAAFPFGAGFLPTQIATTGILGSVVWLLFLVFLVVISVKALTRIPESRGERFTLIFSLMASILLWAGSFFYTPSASVLLLAFIFTGLFLAALVRAGSLASYSIDLKSTGPTKALATLVMLAAVVGGAALGWTGLKKTAAAYHFNQAVKLSNTEGSALGDVEARLFKAVEINETDIYYVALSRLNFARAQAAANAATGTPEQNRAIFEESLRKAIEAARLAVSENPANFENWVVLGNVYSALVPKPLSVQGAYENATFAYNEAARRNPTNPEIPLLLARLEISNENTDNARVQINKSIALKEDYADAYLLLAQLESSTGNTAAAINSAEALTVLLPNNPGIHFELGLLKFSAKDYEGAEASFKKALDLSPDYANAKYYLGLTLANLSKFADAEKQFTDLLQNNADNTVLQDAIKAVKSNKVPAQPTTNNAQPATGQR